MVGGYFKPYLEDVCKNLGFVGLDLGFLEGLLEDRFIRFQNGVYDNILYALYENAESNEASNESIGLLMASTTFKTVGWMALYKAGRGKNESKREVYKELSLKSLKKEWETDKKLSDLGLMTGNDGSFYNAIRKNIDLYVRVLKNLDKVELKRLGDMYAEDLDRKFSTPETRALAETVANELRKKIKPVSEEDVKAIANMTPEELFIRMEELSGDIDEDR